MYGEQWQDWKWCTDGRIVSEVDEKYCLDIPGSDPTQVRYMEMWTCDGSAGQYWNYDLDSMFIYPAQTGETMCLDVDQASSSDGARVVNYPCTGKYTGTSWYTPSDNNGQFRNDSKVIYI